MSAPVEGRLRRAAIIARRVRRRVLGEHDGAGRGYEVCAAVFDALRRAGLKPAIVYGVYGEEQRLHCWVEIAQHVIDPTARQFGARRSVVVVPKRQAGDYCRIRSFTSVRAAAGFAA